MPITALILTVAAIVAFITGSTVVGIICAVAAIALFGFAFMQRRPESGAPKAG